MSLLSAVYVSSATQEFTPEQLMELLRKSRENNHKRGVTGMLLYHDGDFMQMLEGPPGEVESLLQKISLDPRHRRMQVLLRRPVEAAEFHNWSMAFRRTGDLSPQDRQELSDFLSAPEVSSGKPGSAVKLLTTFRNMLR